ncbi:MAG TPA: SPASM domain-containing protein, partial [Ktedonobacteraceae bacterium]|nr:SPASM domain-containing protein [Ktedonobacteraceae bacterium]
YDIVKKTLVEKRQVIPCLAGVASAQIAPNGDVWACCIRAESVGNLREHNYDFRSVWTTAEADEMRRSIKARECYCPLANASYTNMLCHVPTLSSVALTVAKGTAGEVLSSKERGKSAKLRNLPVINAVDEARLANGTNGNGHAKAAVARELNVIQALSDAPSANGHRDEGVELKA